MRIQLHYYITLLIYKTIFIYGKNLAIHNIEPQENLRTHFFNFDLK